MVGKSSYDLPPGFRFHPTDEELIMCYLRNQVKSSPFPISIIPEVDIYKFDPWELPDKTQIGENEWYFFSPRDRKYPNGVRPNRAAVSGYWKATGTDKAIRSGSSYVGVKKALVFYKGRPPKGVKTDWIMHEYRLSDQSRSRLPCNNKQGYGSMRLDDWVLCRIYKKKSLVRPYEQERDEQRVVEDLCAHQGTELATSDDQMITAAQESKFPRTCSLTHLWDQFGYMGSLSQMFVNDSAINAPFNDYQESSSFNNEKNLFGQAVMHQQPCTEAAVKFEVMNPVYHLQ